MGRAPCCDKANVKKGPWSPEEDAKLKEYIEKHGTGGNWIALPQKAGLRRCGKSCRLRWLNYLRPNIKHGEFSDDEDRIICSLFASIGSRWSIIAAQLPGRTDNDIKNYWNTKLKKKLLGIIPSSQRKPNQISTSYPSVLHNSSPISSPYSTLPHYNNYYTMPNIPSNPLESPNNNFTPNATAAVQDLCVQPMYANYHQQIKDGNFLVFGGDQASCSSSDGGSHGREAEYEHGLSSAETFGNFQGYFTNGAEENNKFLLNVDGNVNCNGSSSYAVDEKPNVNTGCYVEQNQLDYSIEEIKQLISTNISNNFNFFLDENKTTTAAAEEKVLYY